MSPTPQQLLQLIESLPDSDKHIFYDEDKFFNEGEKLWYVTNEWLAGSFAGRAFDGATKEEAAQKLIEYLDRHIKHDSIVGVQVYKSGWPNLDLVKNYLEPKEDDQTQKN